MLGSGIGRMRSNMLGKRVNYSARTAAASDIQKIREKVDLASICSLDFEHKFGTLGIYPTCAHFRIPGRLIFSLCDCLHFQQPSYPATVLTPEVLGTRRCRLL